MNIGKMIKCASKKITCSFNRNNVSLTTQLEQEDSFYKCIQVTSFLLQSWLRVRPTSNFLFFFFELGIHMFMS